jgi:hypothetical protein
MTIVTSTLETPNRPRGPTHACGGRGRPHRDLGDDTRLSADAASGDESVRVAWMPTRLVAWGSARRAVAMVLIDAEDLWVNLS